MIELFDALRGSFGLWRRCALVGGRTRAWTVPLVPLGWARVRRRARGYWRFAAAVVAAVSISFALGVPLGIAMASSRRARSILTPILDVMQIMPTFAYLAPLVLFFGIGPASAVIVTLIYAMPAAIRITALGLRNVPVNTVEAGVSMGTTSRQLLRQVRLPLASKELALALKGANDQVKDIFFANMSARGGKMLKDDMEAMGPVRLREVDEAQSRMVATAKDMAARGEIVIAKVKADEEMIA